MEGKLSLRIMQTPSGVELSSPLLTACWHGQFHTVQVLLCDPRNRVENPHYLPLRLACQRGHLALVQYLLDQTSFIPLKAQYNIFAASTPAVIAVLIRDPHFAIEPRNYALQLLMLTHPEVALQILLQDRSLDYGLLKYLALDIPRNVSVLRPLLEKLPPRVIRNYKPYLLFLATRNGDVDLVRRLIVDHRNFCCTVVLVQGQVLGDGPVYRCSGPEINYTIPVAMECQLIETLALFYY